ncbi:lipopolysaccharide biosynthesis protein [Roseivirga pacifica]|uniref:lipopolysaccharide biosynthesis protein n=1 Tax=Roseivirga pacifica TaxID=1267423 RepID=UPI003BAA0BCC
MNLKSIFSGKLLHILQNYLTQVLNVAFILILTAKVSPTELGLYGVARSLFGLLEYSHLGSRFGLDVVVPKEEGVGGKVFSKVVIQTGLSVSVLAALIFSIVYQSVEVYYYLAGAVIYYFNNNVRLFYRANGETANFVKKSLYQNVLTASFQLLGLLFFGFIGVFQGFLLAAVIMLIINRLSIVDIISSGKYQVSKFWTLQKKGKALLVTSMLVLAVNVLDRLFIERYFGLEFAGFFTLVGLCVSSFAILPNSISELAISSIVKHSENLYQSRKILKKIIIQVFGGTLLLVLVSFFLIEPVVNLLFDQYSSIVTELKISLISVLPLGATLILQYYLVAQGKNAQVVMVNVLAFVTYYLGFIGIVNFVQEGILMALVVNKIIFAFLFFILILVIAKKILIVR